MKLNDNTYEQDVQDLLRLSWVSYITAKREGFNPLFFFVSPSLKNLIIDLNASLYGMTPVVDPSLKGKSCYVRSDL